MMHRSETWAKAPAVRAGGFALAGGILLALACAPGPQTRTPSLERPLRVLVTDAVTPLLPGPAGDLERELAIRLADATRRELVLVRAIAGEDVLARLLAGDVDVVATGLAPTTEHADEVVFSLPYRHEDHPVVLGMRAADIDLRRRANEILISRAFTDGSETHQDDLTALRRRGSLRMIARPHVASYYLHGGNPRGFEYELLARFAREQGLALEIVTPPSRVDLVDWLIEGRGDVLAANPDGPWTGGAHLALTRPLGQADLVIVARDDDPERVRDLDDLVGRTLVVRENGAERAVAEQIAAAVEGLGVQVVPDEAGIVQVLAGVGEGRHDLALAPAHLVRVEQQAGRRLEIALRLGTQPMAWGVRTADRELLAALDAFLAREYRGSEYNVLWRRYLHSGTAVADAGKGPTRLSPWDPVVRRWAAEEDLDWRLVAAQMFQESRFELGLVSPAGAEGLMQIVPDTATELGLADPHDPEESIRAGTRYLRRMVDLYEPSLPLATRLRFALASYDAGPGHVIDARRLAAQIGLDPNRWYDNVERAMLLLERPEYFENTRCGYCRGTETVRYVRDIDRRYRLYVQHVPAEPEDPVRLGGSPSGLSAGPAVPLPPA